MIESNIRPAFYYCWRCAAEYVDFDVIEQNDWEVFSALFVSKYLWCSRACMHRMLNKKVQNTHIGQHVIKYKIHCNLHAWQGVFGSLMWHTLRWCSKMFCQYHTSRTLRKLCVGCYSRIKVAPPGHSGAKRPHSQQQLQTAQFKPVPRFSLGQCYTLYIASVCT